MRRSPARCASIQLLRLSTLGGRPNAKRGEIALSFDDGPGPLTVPVLDLLATHNVRATFFLIGSRVAANEHTVRLMATRGHEVGNHTFRHVRIGTLSDAALEDELRSTSREIERVTGSPPRLMRPPFGLDSGRALAAASLLGMTTVGWSVNPEDWDDRVSAEIADRVLDSVHGGDVVLLHEGDLTRQPTLDALEQIIATLKATRYTFVTVSELLLHSRRARRNVIVGRRGLRS
jgi:peptidoglycan/xylan/chitin deacetylase (PgdA/CDA1 family)